MPSDYAMNTVAKPPNLYEQHAQACAEWQQACRDFAAAAERKQNAKDFMDKVSQEFAKFLQDQVCDPTVSRPECTPGNGQLGYGVAAQQGITRPW